MMKFSQKQIVKAYISLMHLSGASMPLGTALSLYQLRKKLEGTYQFCAEQEQVIIERYGGNNQNGSISFSDAESVAGAQADLKELNDMEVELDIEPVSVKVDDLHGLEVTLNDIDALNGFVAFI